MSRNVEPPKGEWDGAAANAVDESLVDVAGRAVFSGLLVANAGECFVVADDAGRIVFANPAVERVFGYDPEALVGRPVRSLIPSRFRPAHRAGFRAYLDSGERTLDWDDVTLVGRHRDGYEIPLSVWFREFTYAGDRYFVGVVRDVTARVRQRDQLASERAFVGSMFDALPDVVYAFDREGRMLRWNDRLEEVTGYDAEAIEARDPFDFIAASDHGRAATVIGRVLEEGRVQTIECALLTAEGESVPYEFTAAPLATGDEVLGVTGVGRDISEHKRYEATLERLNDLNTEIRSVDRALVEATTRGEIAREVCSQLVEAGTYCGAVIGSVDTDIEALQVTAAAGLGRQLAEVIDEGAAGSDPSLVARAVEAESVRVVDGVGAEFDEGGEPDWAADGEGTIAVVPLVADDRTFGVLAVCTDRDGGIPERERAVLDELGATIGNAVQSALTRQLLHADTVTEIELRTTDDAVSFVAASAAADCRLELDRALTFGDEHVFYFSVSDASVERIRDAAASVPSITGAEALTDDRIELRAERGTITSVLTDLGARTTAGVADRGVARITAVLPCDVGVREAVDAVQSAYPDTELAGRRDIEQSLGTPGEFRRGLAADLTDKQQAALEAAYFSGYFEWPARTSDAGAVADTLDIAPQTFHQHLRVAERKLLAALFDGDRRD